MTALTVGASYDEPPAWQLDPFGEPPAPLYADVAAFLANGLPEPPKPVALRREDGHSLFYAGKVNVLFGDPECGKTWVALAAVAQSLAEGRRCAILDIDHNGLRETIARLLALGAPHAALGDPERFRYYEPEDGITLRAVAFQCREWRAAIVVVDSIGEILPMLGYSSNSPDDYTRAHREILTQATLGGACVIAIDHLPKSDEARQRGQTGTMAKLRAVNGASIRVTVRDTFAPGRGGACSLVVHKDRPGGLRAVCPVDGKYQPAGIFTMTPTPQGALSWHVTQPVVADIPQSTANPDDIAALDALDPAPRSVRDIKDRMRWGQVRASATLAAWRIHHGEQATDDR